MFAEDIILKPVLTEKGYDGIADKKYTFIVKNDANKTEIKLAVEKLFGVKVASVNTVTRKGKLKRMRIWELLSRKVGSKGKVKRRIII